MTGFFLAIMKGSNTITKKQFKEIAKGLNQIVTLLIFFPCRSKTKKKKCLLFTEPSSQYDYSHCSKEPSNDSRQPNIEIQIGLVTRSSLNSNAKIYPQVRYVNTEKRKAFDVLCEWAREKVMYMNPNKSQNSKPVHLFITGGVGVGMFHLIYTLKKFFEKILQIMKYRLKNSLFLY